MYRIVQTSEILSLLNYYFIINNITNIRNILTYIIHGQSHVALSRGCHSSEDKTKFKKNRRIAENIFKNNLYTDMRTSISNYFSLFVGCVSS